MKLSIKENLTWLFKLKKQLIYSVLLIIFFTFLLIILFLSFNVKKTFLKNAERASFELVKTIQMSIRGLMIMRNPDFIQSTIENIKTEEVDINDIVGIHILDVSGKIIYSSEKDLINKRYDKLQDRSCSICHKKIGEAPSISSIEFDKNNQRILRVISTMPNEPECYGCHPKEQRITGKLIIDKSMKHIESEIFKIQSFIVGIGIFCFALLSITVGGTIGNKIEKYINEIVLKNRELSILYNMMGKLSKTIDFDELKTAVFEIIKDTFDADEVNIIVKKEELGYRCFTWNNKENTINRKKIDEDSSLYIITRQWYENNFNECVISHDRKEIYIPIEKNKIKMALIVLRNEQKMFTHAQFSLSQVVKEHISVAFENARLYYIAITDELTKLYTQRHFRFCIEREYLNYEKFGAKFSLLICDIDNFKKINDTFGHLVGDTVLLGVAKTILNSIRDNDLAFRYGGEEFAVILPATDLESGKMVAERIRENVESMIYDKGNNNIKVTISIGCASCPSNADTIRNLILLADEALYCAKRTGKNKVITADEMENICKRL
ncbi:MAG: GGDEF domain-containing protein [Proteobacteria bacterium]|nr:GGDEF domain-containing protein [Pseudomonadota bacterium]